MKRFFIALIITVLVLSPIPLRVGQAAGATLFLSPASGDYLVGRTFTVKVMVNSGGGAGINASEATITFDPEFLTVSNLNDSGSIFKLWTADPSYSNAAGTITYGGGAPGAYSGSAGEIFSITFSAKKVGVTDVTFTEGNVLAADGKGTNVFSGFGQGKYTLKEPEKEEPRPRPTPTPKEEEKPKGILPPTPEIESGTHPDEEKWYRNNEPEFTWKLLADLSGVSYLINQTPDFDPGNESMEISETKKFEPQPDGEWYFHIKYENKIGWGKPAHRKFKVDITPPKPFTVSLDNGGDPTNPTPKLVFRTTDETSGIDVYKVSADYEIITVKPAEVEKGYYQLQPLAPGEYSYDVAAIDMAGNGASSTVKFIVDPLKAPIITSIPKIISRKDELIIRGTSFYPRVTVTIYISKSDKEVEEFSTKTDDSGEWSYFHRGKLDKGNYDVWAKLVDERGAQSLDSTKHIMTVISPSIIEEYGWLIFIILLIIIAFLILYIIYLKKEHKEEKMRIKQETDDMKSKLGKIFAALREEVDELIEMADTRPGLSESERRVKEKLQESLDISEEFINKEVEDVEKEIKIGKSGSKK